MERGKCSGLAAKRGDYDLFFEETNISEAKKICKECPVREECLEYALIYLIPDGVWGGVSARKRRPMAKAREKGMTIPALIEAHDKPRRRRR